MPNWRENDLTVRGPVEERHDERGATLRKMTHFKNGIRVLPCTLTADTNEERMNVLAFVRAIAETFHGALGDSFAFCMKDIADLCTDELDAIQELEE